MILQAKRGKATVLSEFNESDTCGTRHLNVCERSVNMLQQRFSANVLLRLICTSVSLRFACGCAMPSVQHKHRVMHLKELHPGATGTEESGCVPLPCCIFTTRF